MAEESTEQDRSEPASQFKLDEARKKGAVAKSTELPATAAMLAGLGALALFGSWAAQHTLQDVSRLLKSSTQISLDVQQTVFLLGQLGRDAIFVLSPLLALVLIGGVLGNLLQTGPVFSTTPLIPDFTRLNPTAGFKRLFSRKLVFDFFKTCLKLGIFLSLAYAVLRGAMPALTGLYQEAPGAQMASLARQTGHLLGVLSGGALLIALVDLIYSRWDFGRRMRMSRKEVKDELKRREGDPRIKERRRALLREMRRRSAAAGNVKDADVLITNPQHFVVALRYRRGKAAAPEVIAKGAGQLAQKLRQNAFRHQVPIVPNPRLARALYRQVRIGGTIPEAHYVAVADVLRWVYQIRQRQTEAGGKP